MKLLSILLLPKRLFENLNDRKWTLYLGVLFVGAVDIYSYIYHNYKTLFTGKSPMELMQNIVLTLLILVVIGVLDVFLFSRPMYDLCVFLKKKVDSKKRVVADEPLTDYPAESVIKVMKVYIIAHIPILPLNLLSNLVYFNMGLEQLTPAIITSLVLIYGLIQVWFNGIITRGLSVIYKTGFEFVTIVFLAVFLWSYLEGLALEYIINNWLLRLLI